MNIGILIPGFSDGEQDWCIPVYLNLVRALAQTDSVCVFAMRYPLRRDQYSIYGARVIALGGGSYTAGLGRVALIARTIATIIRQHRVKPFDVLHAIWADETGFVACIAGWLIHVPVVVSVAGGELVGLPGYGLQSGRVSGWLVKQALAHADCVTVPCQYVFDLLPGRTSPQPLSVYREGLPQPLDSPSPNSEKGLGGEVKKTLPKSTKRTVIVPLGVDPILFSLLPTARIDNRLLAVGSLSNVKGHDKLLHALAQLPDLSLDIVGEGPLLGDLHMLAETLGVATRVKFHGAVAHDALPHFYRSAALHVLTSRHEAFGMVVTEAAACGLPTVGFALGVLNEFHDAQAGIAVPPGDVDALVIAIRNLLGDPDRLALMQDTARQLVESHYTVAAMANGMKQIYTQLQNQPK